jgi:hypothetical protein
MNKQLVATLNFHTQLVEEVERLESQELPIIQDKLNSVLRNKTSVEDKLANFNEHYFKFEE